MDLLSTLFDNCMHEGRLAVKDNNDDNATVYVLWEAKDSEGLVRLVELDRPIDGENHWVDLSVGKVYLLEPLEVVERVNQWKD